MSRGRRQTRSDFRMIALNLEVVMHRIQGANERGYKV